jgi:hypothetical protein
MEIFLPGGRFFGNLLRRSGEIWMGANGCWGVTQLMFFCADRCENYSMSGHTSFNLPFFFISAIVENSLKQRAYFMSCMPSTSGLLKCHIDLQYQFLHLNVYDKFQSTSYTVFL